MKHGTVAVGTILLAVLVACSGGRDDDAQSTSTTGARAKIGRGGSDAVSTTGAIAIGEPLATYSITYRVEERDGDDINVSTSELTSARPFRSRSATKVGKEVASTRVADFGYLGQQAGTAEPVVYTAAPAPAPGDVRTDLLFAGDRGDEVRRVLGRECQVHHLGAPVLSGIVVPLDASEGITADICVDADGLILEELTFDADHVATSRWIATTVEESPSTSDEEFRFEGVTPTAAKEGGGSLQAVEPTSAPPGPFWQLDELPAGFTHMGRYAIVPPQEARVDDPASRSMVIAGVSDVFVRGIDMVVVEQGGTLGQIPPFGSTPNSEVIDLGELARSAEWFLTVTGAEVHALIPPGRYVKVLGTLPSDEIIALAKSLHPIEGQGLVYRALEAG